MIGSIFNKIYNSGEFPEEWKNCTVVPIYKKGDPRDLNNYRGIALINTFLKVLCKILSRRLQNIITDFKILKREQTGFKKDEECLGQVACLLEICQRRKIENKDTILCFLDLKKAYDLVPHNRLINKLAEKGLGPKILKFIEKMYENTEMKVRINNTLTESFKYGREVRQGCPTSPLLFDIFIDDLLNEIKPIEVKGLKDGISGLCYTDDTVILANN